MRSQLTVRMPDDLRTELEAAAKRRHRNLTDELLGRLRASLAREREQRRDPVTRALTFLIADVAEQVHLGISSEWNKVPFLFRAFKLGVAKVLDALEPSGDMRSPYDWAEMGHKSAEPIEQWFIDRYQTPETTAQSAADGTLHLLFGHAAALARLSSEPPSRLWSDEVYGMAAVHRDLKLTPKATEG